MKVSSPEEAGFDSQRLAGIDLFVQKYQGRLLYCWYGHHGC
jgi:hypothetical protein